MAGSQSGSCISVLVALTSLYSHCISDKEYCGGRVLDAVGARLPFVCRDNVHCTSLYLLLYRLSCLNIGQYDYALNLSLVFC